MLGIVLGDGRLACSCLAMETHSMKLLPHRFCADIYTSEKLELFSYGISVVSVGDYYTPCISALRDPT